MLSLTEFFAIFRWWAVLMLLGTAVTPLTYTIFKRLPDKGYAFTKMVGLLLVSYIFWLLSSLGFTANHLGGILLALVIVATLSLWLGKQQGSDIGEWLLANKGLVLRTDLLFTAVFLIWVWVRAQNPAISATEKPMEFAFLNAVGRTPTFPPLDPWLSGYAISYYYFGYVMTSVLARLAAVPEYIAFNLGIAWLAAGTAVGAYGLVYNLVALNGRRSHAIILGIAATIALPLAGNQQITLEIAHANAIGSPAFWEWLDIRDINTPPVAEAPPRYDSTAWWWWRASRVIHEYHLSGRAEEGLEPIAEFPGFSFILGDMHPHVLALPFAFLSLAAALLWYLRAHASARNDQWQNELRPLLKEPLFWFTVITLGGLSFLNTWDVLIHLFIVVAAHFLGHWQSKGWHAALTANTAALAIAIAVPSFLLYLPFYIGFSSQAGAPYLLPMLMKPTRMAHFLVIFGMPLTAVLPMLVLLISRQRLKQWRFGMGLAALFLLILFLLMLLLIWIIAASPEGSARIGVLAAELNLALPPRPDSLIAAGWGVTAVITLLPVLLSARLAAPWLILLLAGMGAAILMVWRHNAEKYTGQKNHPQPPAALPFLLLLIFTGVLLTLGPEFVYLRDNFGQRINTIFKFYYQSWVLFGVAGLASLGWLWQQAENNARKVVPALTTAVYLTLFLFAVQFPIYAAQSRTAEYRGTLAAADRPPATLDGLAYLARFNPDEYAAIMWLRENDALNTAVILEAVGGQYSQYGRVAANTGLPTVLGWAGHEYQWRGPNTPEPDLRDPAVREIYTSQDWDSTARLLNDYQVQYIYVGALEMNTYGQQAYEKFVRRLTPVYTNNSVTIFAWQPEKKES
ncbi:MAG: DUF2298 domain-containing protein [Candidatus Promineifilaceae bacterium]